MIFPEAVVFFRAKTVADMGFRFRLGSSNNFIALFYTIVHKLL